MNELEALGVAKRFEEHGYKAEVRALLTRDGRDEYFVMVRNPWGYAGYYDYYYVYDPRDVEEGLKWLEEWRLGVRK